MIISKYGKSYDTADGSEQHHEALPPPGIGVQVKGTTCVDARSEGRNNEGSLPLVQPPISPLELSATPAWSVLSLSALNRAIRLEDWPDNPVNLRRSEENAEREQRRAIDLKAEQNASRARAVCNRDRNPWENT